MAVVDYQAPQSIEDAIGILRKTDIKSKVMAELLTLNTLTG